MHLIAEAKDRRALARAVQGLCIRIARGLNRLWGRKGKVLADRYHARVLATPLEVRRALAYVLLNQRRHAAQGGHRYPRHWVDSYSSGTQFDGWREPVPRSLHSALRRTAPIRICIPTAAPLDKRPLLSTMAGAAPATTTVKRLAAVYCLYFGALGALVPFLGPYLASVGFSPRAIGELLAVFMGVRVAAPLVAGWLADRLATRMLLVRAAVGVAFVAFFGLFVTTRYWPLAAVLGVFSFAWSAAMPPFEAVTLNHLGARTERYGRLRLWGSVGFILAVGGVGELVERTSPAAILPVTAVLFGGLMLATLWVPDAAAAPAPRRGGSLQAVLSQPTLWALLAGALLGQASHGPYYAFFTLYCARHGYDSSAAGWLWALGVVAEIAMFLATPRLLGGRRLRPLFATSLGLTAVRWLLLGTAPGLLPVVLLAQLLHAFTYGLFHAVSIESVHRLFPGPHQSLGQALYASVAFGGGTALGTLAAGRIWTALGPEHTFLLAAALPAIGAGIALIAFHPPASQGD